MANRATFRRWELAIGLFVLTSLLAIAALSMVLHQPAVARLIVSAVTTFLVGVCVGRWLPGPQRKSQPILRNKNYEGVLPPSNSQGGQHG